MTRSKFIRGMGCLSDPHYTDYTDYNSCYFKSGRLPEIGFRICLRKTC